MSFILTLSEWHVDREVLLDSCPQNEQNKKEFLEEISYYKKFCFPELNSKAPHGGNLVEDVETYVFTRTTANGEIEYGYCRRIVSDNQVSKFPIIICIGKRIDSFIWEISFLQFPPIHTSNSMMQF